MRGPLIAGNWKMHGSLAGVRALVDGILAGVGACAGRVDIALFPAYVHLPEVLARTAGSRLLVGAQDADEHDAGAYTGAVSAPMLSDLGCRMVIVGHSERRACYGDDNARVARKFRAVRSAGMRPVLCVGETLAERDAGRTEAVVLEQLDTVIELVGRRAVCEAVLAYEPVWAIGTGRSAGPAQAQRVHALLRKHLGSEASDTPVLYGGSVKPDNAAQLLAEADVDGALVGGASLDPVSFLAICRAAIPDTTP